MRRELVLRVSRGVVRAEVTVGGAVTPVAEAAWMSPEDLHEAIARVTAELPERTRRTRVLLERPFVQLRTIPNLPPVKPKELAAIVANQPGRFFRRNGTPLVTDAVWTTQDGNRVARAAAVEEPVLAAIAAGARAAGLDVWSIAPSEVAAPLSLLPTGEREGRERRGRVRLRRLGVAAGLAWLAASTLFVGRLVLERRRVDAELAAIQAPLRAILEARRQIREAEGTILALAAAERGRGRALTLLAALGRALPDSAVITSFTVDARGGVILSGAARRAADVLAALERSRAVPGPRFEGPIVREAVAGREWERFTIVAGQPQPGGRLRVDD